MDKAEILESIESLSLKKIDALYLNDFLLTWDKSEDEIAATLQTAEILRAMRQDNISCRMFETGLAISIYWRFKNLMRKNHRLPTAKPYGRRLT